jgi:hypothetical protein
MTSFGNTSSNSCNIGKSTRLGPLYFFGSTTWYAYNWHPFLKHLINYKFETFLIYIGLGIPYVVLWFPSLSRQINVML